MLVMQRVASLKTLVCLQVYLSIFLFIHLSLFLKLRSLPKCCQNMWRG